MPLDSGSYTMSFMSSGSLEGVSSLSVGTASEEPDAVDFLTSAVLYADTPGFDANHTESFDSGTTGDGRYLVVYVGYENGGNPNITGITYGGQALAKQLEETVSPGDEFSETIEQWTLTDPPTGVNDLVMANDSTTEDAMLGAAVYVNVNQDTPINETFSDPRPLSDNGVFDIGTTFRGGVAWGIVKDRGGSSNWTAEPENTIREQQSTKSANDGTASNFVFGDTLDTDSGTETCGATQSSPDSFNNAQDIAIVALSLNVAADEPITGDAPLMAQQALLSGSGNVLTSVTGSGALQASAAQLEADNKVKTIGGASIEAQQAQMTGIGTRTLNISAALAATRAEIEADPVNTGHDTWTAEPELVASPATIQADTEIIARPTGITAEGALQAHLAGMSVETKRGINGHGVLQPERVRLYMVTWLEQDPVGTAWLDLEGGHWMIKIFKQ